jgi:hypothetical protein
MMAAGSVMFRVICESTCPSFSENILARLRRLAMSMIKRKRRGCERVLVIL